MILILDVGGLAARAKLEIAEKALAKENAAQTGAAASDLQSIILFNHGSEELLAVPQEQLLRLEKTHVNQIERIGGREFVQYRGAAMPVVRLDSHLPVRPCPPRRRTCTC